MKIKEVTWGKAAIVVMTVDGDSVALLPERWGWACSTNNSDWDALERATIEDMFEDGPNKSELLRLMDIIDHVRELSKRPYQIDENNRVHVDAGKIMVGFWPIRPVGMSAWRLPHSAGSMTTSEALEYIAREIGPEVADQVRPYMDLVNAARRAFIETAIVTNTRFGS